MKKIFILAILCVGLAVQGDPPPVDPSPWITYILGATTAAATYYNMTAGLAVLWILFFCAKAKAQDGLNAASRRGKDDDGDWRPINQNAAFGLRLFS